MKLKVKIVVTLVIFAFMIGLLSNLANAESLLVTAIHTVKVAKHKTKKAL